MLVQEARTMDEEYVNDKKLKEKIMTKSNINFK